MKLPNVKLDAKVIYNKDYFCSDLIYDFMPEDWQSLVGRVIGIYYFCGRLAVDVEWDYKRITYALRPECLIII